MLRLLLLCQDHTVQQQQQQTSLYENHTGQPALATARPLEDFLGAKFYKQNDLVTAQSNWGEDAGILLNSVIYTVSTTLK